MANKKGDMAVDTIFTIIISLSAIMVLLSLFGYNLTGFGKEVYCKTFFHIGKALPGSLKVEESECKGYQTINVYDILPVNETTGQKCYILDELMANALACWQKAGYGRQNKDYLCAEVHISANCPSLTPPLNETNATNVLIRENVCSVLANNDTGVNCGDKNQIDWRISSLNPGMTFLIEYDSKNRRLIIA